MADVTYSNLSTLDASISPIDKSQTSFLKLHNYVANKKVGSIISRGGSAYSYAAGDILGLGLYSLKNSTSIAANHTIIIRYRKDGSNIYVEKYDWATNVWTEVEPESTSHLDFGGDGVASICQISDALYIAANRPAKILDVETGKVTRLGGPAPTSAPTTAFSSTGITGTVAYAYTFYDPTTGWESSPSPVTAFLTPSNQGVKLTSLATTCAREGVTKKNIYRTETSGDFPLLFLVEIDLATTEYTDTGAIALGDNMPDTGDHEPPPDSYIMEVHQDRLFVAAGDELYYSKTFDGSYATLEYFSEARRWSLGFTIKGIKSAPNLGGLLVFGAPGRGIKLLVGSSDTDFEMRDYFPNEGSNYHQSITVKGNQCVYWGTKGPRMIQDGNIVEDFGAGIQEYIDDISSFSFTAYIYIWSIWHEDTGQFLFGVGGLNADDVNWADVDRIVDWADDYNNTVVWYG